MSIDATSVHVSKISQEMKQTRSSRADSPGFCDDIGAPKSCIGLKELKYVFLQLGRRVLNFKWSPNQLRSADTSYESLGKA